MQTAGRYTHIKRVCIIGAGPAGVAAAKHLVAERYFDTIDIYDQRSESGGVWCYEPENDQESTCPVPSTDPEVPLERPRWRGNPRRATYQSPMYARLEANLPKMLMQHSDLDFSKELQLFPKRTDILEYLDRYADDVKHLVQPDRQVSSVRPVKIDSSRWVVNVTDLRRGRNESSEYDAVIAACGHYTVPFIPEYEGMKEFANQHQRVISHSKWFDDPEAFRDQTVLVIGLGPSGVDIASQIAEYSSKPLFVSTRSTPTYPPHGAKSLPAITEFIPEKRGVRFANDDHVNGLDAIIFCTGYLYCYPFLPDALRKDLIYPPPDQSTKFTPGDRCRDVYQHLFYTPNPTLAFLTLPWNIVPFPVAEGQGAVVARLWSGRLEIPSQEWMQQWERETEAVKGTGKSFHKLAPPSDVEYINMLYRWAGQASDASDSSGLSNGYEDNRKTKFGKQPPYWGSYQYWMRMNVSVFKKAFAEKGEERHKIRTLEELGFHFHEQL